MMQIGKAIELYAAAGCQDLKYVSVGGGFMGPMSEELALEMPSGNAAFDDYAGIVGEEFKKSCEKTGSHPMLILEPGSALAANAMSLVTKVVNIKRCRNKYYATLSGSTYNMNPSVKGINRPIEIIEGSKKRGERKDSVDFVGYTCIEGDVLYRDYKGCLEEGDSIIFNNVGSYSIGMKPPFILPDIAILSYDTGKLIRKAQDSEQVFENFII